MFNPLEICVFCLLSLVTWRVLRRVNRQPTVAEKTNSVTTPKKFTRLRMLPVKAEGNQFQTPVQRFDNWFHRTVVLTTSTLSTWEATWWVIGCAAVAGMAAFVATEEAGPTLLAALAGMLLAICGFAWAYRRMVSQFQEQLPQAMDLMARAVRAGESLEQAVALVAQSLDDPLRTEFRRCLNQVEMGLPVRKAMASMAGRVDTLDTRIFGSTVAVHRETGGNLAETLERLAEVIRKRFEYHQKLRSTTGAGRISVMIIALLGVLVFGYMFLFRPDYGSELWEDPTGRMMLLVAFVSEVIGLIWVQFLLRADY